MSLSFLNIKLSLPKNIHTCVIFNYILFKLSAIFMPSVVGLRMETPVVLFLMLVGYLLVMVYTRIYIYHYKRLTGSESSLKHVRKSKDVQGHRPYVL